MLYLNFIRAFFLWNTFHWFHILRTWSFVIRGSHLSGLGLRILRAWQNQAFCINVRWIFWLIGCQALYLKLVSSVGKFSECYYWLSLDFRIFFILFTILFSLKIRSRSLLFKLSKFHPLCDFLFKFTFFPKRRALKIYHEYLLTFIFCHFCCRGFHYDFYII